MARQAVEYIDESQSYCVTASMMSIWTTSSLSGLITIPPSGKGEGLCIATECNHVLFDCAMVFRPVNEIL